MSWYRMESLVGLRQQNHNHLTLYSPLQASQIPPKARATKQYPVGGSTRSWKRGTGLKRGAGTVKGGTTAATGAMVRVPSQRNGAVKTESSSGTV
jgi:hypothetical protein